MKCICTIAIMCLIFTGCSTSSTVSKITKSTSTAMPIPSASKTGVRTAESIQVTKPTLKVKTKNEAKSNKGVMYQHFRDMVRRDPEKLTNCTIYFHRGLPKDFNLYNSWPSYCNSVRDMELFRHSAYKKYGPKGLLHYPGFEKDFRKLQSMTMKESKKRAAAQPKKVYTPSSGSKCHYVRGYRRKSGTYVSGYTRCR